MKRMNQRIDRPKSTAYAASAVKYARQANTLRNSVALWTGETDTDQFDSETLTALSMELVRTHPEVIHPPAYPAVLLRDFLLKVLVEARLHGGEVR